MAWSLRVLLCVCAGLSAPFVGDVGRAPLRVHAQDDAGVPEVDRGARGEEAFKQALARLKSSDATERASAADELGKRGYRFRQQISVVLRPLLASDPESVVRAAAGRALGRLGSRDAVPQLVGALDDRSVEVRVVAAAALWRLPDASAVPALLRRAADDDRAVREWSALALGVAADARAVPVLIKLLDDAERAVRLAAVRSLGRVNRADALAPLAQYGASSKRDDEERDEVINAIVGIDSPERVDTLLRLLDTTRADPRMRARVALALGRVGNATALPALRKLVRDPVPAVRDAAKSSVASLQTQTTDKLGAGHAQATDAARP